MSSDTNPLPKKFVGRISGWDDAKGYGFVMPQSGGARAFVHISAFSSSTRRPVDGDLIAYSVTKDSQGRTNAINVRFAGERSKPPQTEKRLPRAWFGFGVLVAIGLSAVFGKLPLLVAMAYGIASVVSYLMYALDKACATRGLRRTSEASLHMMDLLCGWPGGLIAQQHFRHKTIKTSFQTTFWLTVFANTGFMVWLALNNFAGMPFLSPT